MVPGFSLRNLALVQHPRLESAFDAVDVVATPSGHFEEGHRADHAAFHLSHQADGLGTDTLPRFRPWGGGDVAAAVLAYLIGAEPDARTLELRLTPHLPHGWPSMRANNVRMGGERYDLEVEQFEEGVVVRVARVAGGALWTLSLAITGEAPLVNVWVNGESVDVEAGGTVTVEGLELGDEAVEVIAAYES